MKGHPLQTIPGARFTGGTVVGFDGQDPVGPEAGGAVMVLHMTAVDEAVTQHFLRHTGR